MPYVNEKYLNRNPNLKCHYETNYTFWSALITYLNLGY